MSRKYDMRICKCGRIHMVDEDKLERALKNNKNLLLVCGGCGAATQSLAGHPRGKAADSGG